MNKNRLIRLIITSNSVDFNSNRWLFSWHRLIEFWPIARHLKSFESTANSHYKNKTVHSKNQSTIYLVRHITLRIWLIFLSMLIDSAHVLSNQFHSYVSSILLDDHPAYNTVLVYAKKIDKWVINDRGKEDCFTEFKMINVGFEWAGKNCISRISCSAILQEYFQMKWKSVIRKQTWYWNYPNFSELILSKINLSNRSI